MNVLIAEPMAQAGIELFQAQPGWNVIVSNPKEYAKHLGDAEALVVRSVVQVNAAVLKQAPKLRVIGRAGVGVDNVDLPAATAAGVLVMNTPGGNAVSVAEHTIALMLSMARSIPQANASTKAGKWEKKKFLGNELRGKTWASSVSAASAGKWLSAPALLRCASSRTIPMSPPRSPKISASILSACRNSTATATISPFMFHLRLETDKLLNKEAFAKMKKGVRIVNCARGELVDEGALKEAIESGKVAGAALDVFSKEPTDASYPLFALDTRTGHASHRRLHRRSPGDRRRSHRRTDGGVSPERRRHQCGQHASACRRINTRPPRPISTSPNASATSPPIW